MIYTVDEVSDLLGIPRPTLYRYLREYSIPHVRRSGKISIPEESFDRIKEARELHREGLGTASVRRRLREGNDPLDAEELTERLDRLSGALERLQGDQGSANNGVSLYKEETLQDILEKQEILIAAVSDLAEKVETLLSTNEQFRTVSSNRLAPSGLAQEKTFLRRAGRFYEAAKNTSDNRSTRGFGGPAVVGGIAAGVMVEEPAPGAVTEEDGHGALEDDATTRIYPSLVESLPAPGRREKFGVLSRRRRRVILALLLLALLAGSVSAWGIAGSAGDEEVEQAAIPDEQSAEEENSQSAPEVGEETPPAPKAEVPNLAGMTLPEAENELASAGLAPGTWNEIPDYEVPAGRVVAQDPETGEEVDPETPVDLSISSGPPVYAPEFPAGGDAGTGQYPGTGSVPPDGGTVFSPWPL